VDSGHPLSVTRVDGVLAAWLAMMSPYWLSFASCHHDSLRSDEDLQLFASNTPVKRTFVRKEPPECVDKLIQVPFAMWGSNNTSFLDAAVILFADPSKTCHCFA
jgi:hypothetical protein